MKDGFLKVAAATPDIKVADTVYNTAEIIKNIEAAAEKGAKVIVFPELSITGYTCGDLFLQESLVEAAAEALKKIVWEASAYDMLVFVGLPVQIGTKLYNVSAAIKDGKVLGFIPKTNVAEASEERCFARAWKKVKNVDFCGESIPMGTDIVFSCVNMPQLGISAELGEDLFAPISPSARHALAGASLIVNSSADADGAGRREFKKQLAAAHSAKNLCAYMYCEAGEGESTTDLVYTAYNIAAENGKVLTENKGFNNGIVYADIDLGRIAADRKKMNIFAENGEDYTYIKFDFLISETKLERNIEQLPFICEKNFSDILAIQTAGLKKRLRHTNTKRAVVGISGGLDSTLALIVTAKAFDELGIDRNNIDAITMPCFGTSDRTYTNACEMARRMGVSLTEIDIKEAVLQHFRNVGIEENKRDLAYENSQARERTQVLMDYANKAGAMVIGTGDMSELALGWATYNGDHMSMYGVNASVSKTLVRRIVRHYAESCGSKELSEILIDVIDTPVSPELLPPEEGKIAQKTEDIVGPYELHDFFMYYVLRYGFKPAKIFRMAKHAFAGVYDDETIRKWLKTFYRRFFAQQFKRSCLPDGPSTGAVGLSPRAGLRMPSDAVSSLWLKEIDEI